MYSIGIDCDTPSGRPATLYERIVSSPSVTGGGEPPVEVEVASVLSPLELDSVVEAAVDVGSAVASAVESPSGSAVAGSLQASANDSGTDGIQRTTGDIVPTTVEQPRRGCHEADGTAPIPRVSEYDAPMLVARIAAAARLVALVLASCADPGDGAATEGSGSSGGTASGTSASTTTASTASDTTTASSTATTSAATTMGTMGTTVADTGSDTATGGDVCDWGDGVTCPPGTVLFCEGFDDDDLAGRGWYDGGGIAIDPDAYSGAGAFACNFASGGTTCAGGVPARHPITESASVWLSYYVRYSANWVGSGQPYHPHEFHFVTNEDDDYVGPAATHLTTYIEDVAGVPRLAIQDALNVDANCILRNDDSFVGCDGDFDSYVFTEMRSAAACNGLLGALDGRDCFDAGGGVWYSARFWDADVQVFADAAPYDKTQWHHVEAYFQLNTIADGVAAVDGQVKYWYDDQLIIDHDDVLLRTGVHDAMRFDQFLMLPYIGDGSPVDQTFWVDDLRVATAPSDAPCP